MIRPYTTEDKEDLVAILRLNIPRYFDEAEESDFITYLDYYREDYFVVEEEGKIIGSGGINYFTAENLARISWDVLHPDFQGKGIGKALTLSRIDYIRKNPAIDVIVVRTTQLVYGFYSKLGFELEKVEKDFWAQGFDLYQMKLELDKHSASKNKGTTVIL